MKLTKQAVVNGYLNQIRAFAAHAQNQQVQIVKGKALTHYLNQIKVSVAQIEKLLEEQS